MEAYLPFIAAVIVAAITAYANYHISNLKNKVDAKTLVTSASDALRDDLLGLVDRYEAREKILFDKNERNEQQNEELRETVNALRIEVTSLRIENQDLKAEVQKLRKELEVFERKVYYIGDKNK